MIFPALTQWDAQEWLDQVESHGVEVIVYEGELAGMTQGFRLPRCMRREVFRGLSDEQIDEIRELVE